MIFWKISIIIILIGINYYNSFQFAEEGVLVPTEDDANYFVSLPVTFENSVCVQAETDSELYCLSNTEGGFLNLKFPFLVPHHLRLSVREWGGACHAGCQNSYYFGVPLSSKPELASRVTIVYPEYGALCRWRLEVGISHSGVRDTDSIVFETVGTSPLVLAPHTEVIESKVNNLDPGSFFFSIRSADGRGGFGLPVRGYLEYVLSQQEIVAHRRFVSSSSSSSSDSAAHKHSPYIIPPLPGPNTARALNSTINICFVGADIMDGQRRIWLSQSRHMSPDRFHFTWILGLANGHDQIGFDERKTVRFQLSSMENVAVLDSPGFEMDHADLLSDPEDGRSPASASWNGNVEHLFQYAHESLLLYNYSIDAVRPLWCRRIYQRMRVVLTEQSRPCQVVVYGNTRLAEDGRTGGDVLITDTARALGIPSVAELMNLYVSREILPTAIVAPSLYAAEHDSVQAVVKPLHSEASVVVRSKVVVIPPSVDTELFDSARFRAPDHLSQRAQEEDRYRHPACSITWASRQDINENDHWPCVVVGFVARLAPEKNPGLFLQMARRLLELHPFARFTVVGDGALRTALEDLSARLRISWAVHFTGLVASDDLPAVLAGIDIVMNPSLRAWSETFCISNIEAMSMGVPLVTFAVGGIGEYVAAPSQLSADDSKDSIDELPDFSVGTNAVVVHRASPTALAEAALHLVLRPALRRELAAAGRLTVLSEYGIHRQMRQYAQLYEYLVGYIFIL